MTPGFHTISRNSQFSSLQGEPRQGSPVVVREPKVILINSSSIRKSVDISPNKAPVQNGQDTQSHLNIQLGSKINPLKEFPDSIINKSPEESANLYQQQQQMLSKFYSAFSKIKQKFLPSEGQEIELDQLVMFLSQISDENKELKLKQTDVRDRGNLPIDGMARSRHGSIFQTESESLHLNSLLTGKEATIKNLESKIEILEKEKQLMSQRLEDELKNFKNLTASFNQDIAARDGKILKVKEKLKKDRLTSIDANNSLKILQNEIDILTRKILAKEAELETTTQLLETKDKRILSLEHENQVMRGKVEEMAKNEAVSEMRIQMSELEANLKYANQIIEIKDKTLGEQSKELREMRASFDGFKAENQILKFKLNEKLDELKQVHTRVSEVDVKYSAEKIAETEKSLATVNKMLVDELNSKLDMYRTKITEYQTEIDKLNETLRQQQSRHTTEVEGLLSCIKEKQNLIDDLSKETQTLHERNMQISHQFKEVHQSIETFNQLRLDSLKATSRNQNSSSDDPIDKEYQRIMNLYEMSFTQDRDELYRAGNDESNFSSHHHQVQVPQPSDAKPTDQQAYESGLKQYCIFSEDKLNILDKDFSEDRSISEIQSRNFDFNYMKQVPDLPLSDNMKMPQSHKNFKSNLDHILIIEHAEEENLKEANNEISAQKYRNLLSNYEDLTKMHKSAELMIVSLEAANSNLQLRHESLLSENEALASEYTNMKHALNHSSIQLESMRQTFKKCLENIGYDSKTLDSVFVEKEEEMINSLSKLMSREAIEQLVLSKTQMGFSSPFNSNMTANKTVQDEMMPLSKYNEQFELRKHFEHKSGQLSEEKLHFIAQIASLTQQARNYEIALAKHLKDLDVFKPSLSSEVVDSNFDSKTQPLALLDDEQSSRLMAEIEQLKKEKHQISEKYKNLIESIKCKRKLLLGEIDTIAKVKNEFETSFLTEYSKSSRIVK